MGDQWAVEEGGADAADLWCCIRCRGSLRPHTDESVTCVDCGADYPAVDGIPDLRTRGGSTYADDDLADARRLSAACRGASLEAVMDKLCDRPEHDDATRALRVRQILESPQRLLNWALRMSKVATVVRVPSLSIRPKHRPTAPVCNVGAQMIDFGRPVWFPKTNDDTVLVVSGGLHGFLMSEAK